MTDYNQQATDFITSTKISITKTFTGTRLYFPTDTESRDTYLITITRLDDAKKSFSFDFGDSIHDTQLRAYRHSYMDGTRNVKAKLIEQKEIKAGPTEYTILSIASSESYEHDNFQDFCDSSGYETDSRQALETYLKCQEMSKKINRFFTATEIETLREIQ